MAGSRESAIARATACFDDGRYLAALQALVAVPTESQMPERLPDLRRYCAETIPPMIAGMGFESQVLDNPDASAGPVLVARRIEDPALPTVLVYGHGDVVRDTLAIRRQSQLRQAAAQPGVDRQQYQQHAQLQRV